MTTDEPDDTPRPLITTTYSANPGGMVSSVRVERGEGHDRVIIFNRGARAGSIVVRAGDGWPLACRLVHEGETSRELPPPPTPMPPSWKVGDPVWYQPVLGGRWYQATVRTEPWQLKNGMWVVHLTDLPPSYGTAVGIPGRTGVHAADAVLHVRARPPGDAREWREP